MAYTPNRWNRFLDWLYRDDIFMHEREWVELVYQLWEKKSARRFQTDSHTLHEHHRRGVKP